MTLRDMNQEVFLPLNFPRDGGGLSPENCAIGPFQGAEATGPPESLPLSRRQGSAPTGVPEQAC